MSGTDPATSLNDDVSNPVAEKQQTHQTEAVNDVEPEDIQNPYFANAAQPQGASKKLPPWLDHFNAKDLKNLFKCSVAVWIQTVLIFINPTLRVMGQAAFVGCIVLFLAPPAGILIIQLMAAVCILLGLLLGWAWGVITMKAALATRPAADLEARFVLLQHMAQNATNAGQTSSQSEYTQIQTFNGFFLDTRVTVTYFCMMGLFVYLVARLRVAAPKLILIQLLAVIVSNAFFTDAPLIPTFDGTLAKTFVIPCAIAAGVGIVCNIFIFPTSSSYEALHGMKKLMSPMPAFLDACLFSFKHPSLAMNKERLIGTKTQILMTYKALELATNFLPMDVSIGKWSSNDLSTLNEPLRGLVIAFLSLLEVHRAKDEHTEKDAAALKMAETTYDEPDEPTAKPGHHQMGRAVDFRLKTSHPNRDVLMEKSLLALSSSSDQLIDSCKQSFAAILEALAQSNSGKGSDGPAEMLHKHKEALKELKKYRDAFVDLTAQHLLEPHSHLFDDNGLLKMEGDHFPPLSGLMWGLLFEERLLQLSDALDKLLSRIVELESTRTKVQLWLPNRLMGLVRWIFRTDGPENPIPGADISGPRSFTSNIDPAEINSEGKTDEKSNSKSAHAQLVSMRTPNSRKRSKTSQILLKITHWFGSTEGVYALRVLVVTLALTIPAVTRSSAGFYYREKGLWAVIMAQLSMVPYTADLVYGIIVRTIGTIVGGVIGMVAWYIGAGDGPGSPYGMAAIMAVVIVVFMWWRLFSPPALMPAGIMMASTTYLVVAYSWINTHTPSYGNSGVGYTIFWKRLVLVLVGFAAAVIVNFLPKPPSANRHYRRLLSESLASVRDRYALFASNWSDPAPDLREVAEREALACGEVLLSITGPIQLTRLEFSTSNFDANTLSQICQLCTVLNQSITQLLIYTVRLPAEQKARIIPSIGAIDGDLIAELMAVLSLMQQALKSGDPLPAVLPTPLFARSIKFARQFVKQGPGETGGLFVRDGLRDEGLRKYAAVLNAFVQLLGALDELVLVLKRVVGETSDVHLPEMV
ncbi:hypothetical protein EG329_006376 [Mollisiaceae sp. DMI_Dod_QoI]|nr:hypothetical protein EG329_006376 [Helotiales sp. DMI_Dod_QoI]